MKLLNIGFSNLVTAEKIVAVLTPDSAPVKRIVAEAREKGQLVDATAGRRTRAVLMMDGGHVILSAVQPDTIAGRMHSDT